MGQFVFWWANHPPMKACRVVFGCIYLVFGWNSLKQTRFVVGPGRIVYAFSIGPRPFQQDPAWSAKALFCHVVHRVAQEQVRVGACIGGGPAPFRGICHNIT